MSMEQYFKFPPINAQGVQIDSESYHADKTSINASGMKDLDVSPLRYWSLHLNPRRERKKATPAMEFGTLCHACVLEPLTVKDVCKTLGSTTVKRLDEAEAVAKSVSENEFCDLITMGIGIPEHTVFWTELVELDDGSIVEVKCKARIDWCVKPNAPDHNGFIYDLKTTKDASEEEFERQAYNLGYHLSAAWYYRAFYAENGVLPDAFFFIAAENDEPHDVSVYQEWQENIESGWKDCVRLLKIYAQCMRDNKWPGYKKEIKLLKRPRWAKENYNG